MIIEYLRYCHPWIPLRCDPAKLFHDGQNIRLLIFSKINNNRRNFIDLLKLPVVEYMQQAGRLIESKYIPSRPIISEKCGLYFSVRLIASANFANMIANIEFKVGHCAHQFIAIKPQDTAVAATTSRIARIHAALILIRGCVARIEASLILSLTAGQIVDLSLLWNAIITLR